jgi:Saxitoxin biosynthesis operon protein SxtJ
VNVRDKYFGSHEFVQRVEVAKTSSDRNFGLVFAAFFGLLGSLGVWHGTARWPIWLGLAVVMLILAFAAPKLLSPLNWVWTKIGLLLHTIVSPVILAVLFYVCVTPVGYLMRLAGTDPLRRRYDAAADTYWIKRDPPGPQPDTFRHQF